MSLWLIVAARSLRLGKSRLANVLSSCARHRLNTRFLTHTLEVAKRFPGAERTLVVTACDEIEALCHPHGVRTLREPAAAGLNGALHEARQHARSLGATELLVMPCDLPLLDVMDLHALAHAGSAYHGVSHEVVAGSSRAEGTAAVGRVVVASDRVGAGTNGLFLPAAAPIEFQFGRASAARHAAAARVAGLHVTELHRPGLTFDVDTAQDLSLMTHILRARVQPAILTPLIPFAAKTAMNPLPFLHERITSGREPSSAEL
jgi:2-phospho-L-lactate/phosphoenolpyruvate guanylyltransferase